MRLVIAPCDMLVISPHLDDAAFGCGELIAATPESLVVTLFAGIPSDTGLRTEWDCASGFSSAQQAMAARRREDRAALERLGARGVWLAFLDAQYGDRTPPDQLAGRLTDVVRSVAPERILLPAGLFHADHVAAHEAALEAMRALYRTPVDTGVSGMPAARWRGADWLMYEDACYRRLPGLLQRRLATLLAAGITATPVRPGPGGRDAFLEQGDATSVQEARMRKEAALQCYASQLRALGSSGRPGVSDLHAPERYWRLAPD